MSVHNDHYSDPPRSSSRRDHYERPDPTAEGKSVLVKNLKFETSPSRVRKIFERHGPVRDVYIPLDYFSRRPRGFAFVEFFSGEENIYFLLHWFQRKKIVEFFFMLQKTRRLVFLADDASVAVRTLHRTLVDGNEVSEKGKDATQWVIFVTKARWIISVPLLLGLTTPYVSLCYWRHRFYHVICLFFDASWRFLSEIFIPFSSHQVTVLLAQDRRKTVSLWNVALCVIFCVHMNNTILWRVCSPGRERLTSEWRAIIMA